MIERLKEFLRPAQHGNTMFVEVNSSLDYNNLPQGFFRCITASGIETLGFRGCTGTSFDCGTVVVDGAERHALSIPRDQLPTVKLDYGRQQSDRLLDTSELDEFDGNFEFTPLR